MECAISEIQFSVRRWTSQVPGFGFPKPLMKKRRVLSILFRSLRFTRTDGRYRFFENGKAKEVTRGAYHLQKPSGLEIAIINIKQSIQTRSCGDGNHYKIYPHQLERLKGAEK